MKFYSICISYMLPTTLPFRAIAPVYGLIRKKGKDILPFLFLYFLYHFIIALTVAFITGYAMGEEVKRGWVPI